MSAFPGKWSQGNSKLRKMTTWEVIGVVSSHNEEVHMLILRANTHFLVWRFIFCINSVYAFNYLHVHVYLPHRDFFCQFIQLACDHCEVVFFPL